MYFLLLLACRDPDQQPRLIEESMGLPGHAAVVWNGFSHVWGYNHRINSFGDYVEPVSCEPEGCAAEVVHTAASGSGSDVAQWSSHYTRVAAPDVLFLGGTSRFVVDREAAEGELIAFTVTVVVPAATLADQDQVHALLNGFDVLATGDADKLSHLTLAVGEPEVDGDNVAIPIDVALLLDCDSVECDGTFQTDESVHYELLVSWLLVAGGSSLAVTPASAETAYTWRNGGLDDEIGLADPVAQGEIEGDRARPYAAAALGFTGFSVDLDDDHHMAEWATRVEPGRYDRVTGRLPFDANLAFKQWNAGTWWNPVSYTSPGAAAMRADLVMLEFEDACVLSDYVSGAIAWTADGGPATVDAVAREIVDMGACA